MALDCTHLINSDAPSQGSSLEWLQILKRAKKRASKVRDSHVLDLRKESKQLPWGAGVTGKSDRETVSKLLFIHEVCTEKDSVLPDQKTKQRTPRHSQPLINFFM